MVFFQSVHKIVLSTSLLFINISLTELSFLNVHKSIGLFQLFRFPFLDGMSAYHTLHAFHEIHYFSCVPAIG